MYHLRQLLLEFGNVAFVMMILVFRASTLSVVANLLSQSITAYDNYNTANHLKSSRCTYPSMQP